MNWQMVKDNLDRGYGYTIVVRNNEYDIRDPVSFDIVGEEKISFILNEYDCRQKHRYDHKYTLDTSKIVEVVLNDRIINSES